MADKIDINALVAQAEAEGAAKTPKAKKDTAVKLPAGLHLDPSGSSINIFGIDRRVPSGFITYVYDANNNAVGAVSHGTYAPFKTETQDTSATPAAKKPSVDTNKINQAQAVSFQYAQSLQDTAKQEYDDLKVQAEIISRGSSTPQQKADFERAARTYKSTMDAIQAAYEKSGAIQGSVNLDPTTGSLVQGSTYVDPAKPQEGPKTVTSATTATPTSQITTGAAQSQAAQQAAALPLGVGQTTPPAGAGAGGAGGAGGNKQTTTPDATTGSETKLIGGNADFVPTTTPPGANQPFGLTPFESANQSQQQQFINQFGGLASMAFATPWIAKILDQAIVGKWDGTKFAETVRQAPEYSSWSQAVQEGNLAYYGDVTHQAWAEKYNNTLRDLRNSATLQGLDPSVFGQDIDVKNPSAIQAAFADKNNPVNVYLSQYFKTPASDAVFSQFVANHAGLAKSTTGSLGGTLAATAADLRAYAAQYGVASQYLTPTWSGAAGSVSQGPDYWSNAASAIEKGYTNAETEKALYRQQAQIMYKPFAQQIADGYSVAQLASPYTSAVQSLLELGNQPIDLGSTTGYGSMVTKALMGDGTNPMNLDQFTTQIKQRPEWLQTTNARNSLMDTATQLLRNFGMVVGG